MNEATITLCLQPAIILSGIDSVEEVDTIDDACEDQGVGLYYGMTSN